MAPFAFRALPVFSARDATLDFEQLQAELLNVPWRGVTLEHGWKAFEATNRQPEVRKVNGIVYLRGVIKEGEENKSAFTLPVGFRPGGGNTLDFIVEVEVVGKTGVVAVLANGEVAPQGVPAKTFTFLHQIFFSVD